MTEYKLIKELPGLEVGEIIDNSFNFSLSYLKNTGWIEEIKEPKSIYELKEGDEYFYIDDLGYIQSIVLDYIQYYELRLEIGNTFLTKQEAEKELDKRKALSKIRKWIFKNNMELSKDFDGYTIYAIPEEVVVGENLYCRNEFGIIFYSKEDAEKCLEKCKQEREILYELN